MAAAQRIRADAAAGSNPRWFGTIVGGKGHRRRCDAIDYLHLEVAK